MYILYLRSFIYIYIYKYISSNEKLTKLFYNLSLLNKKIDTKNIILTLTFLKYYNYDDIFVV
jgi:hypothetical protein